MVLLDAAAFVPTNRLDLSFYHPDFVSLSFYKMFGFPTGLGALLLRNEHIAVLNKFYWGGGTVSIASDQEHFCVFHVGSHKLGVECRDGRAVGSKTGRSTS